jgi:hypothetical protein
VRIPQGRGPLSAAVADALRTGAAPDPGAADGPGAGAAVDDDLQLALWCCYELHYRGFDDAPSDLEWDPVLLEFRAALERRFLADIAARLARPGAADAADVPGCLARMTADDGGRSLSRHLRSQADRAQFAEFVVHRSIYHLKEADPHSWGIPRLSGAPKAAMVEIQFDEYGAGRAARMHSELFRVMMRGLGLDDNYGAYIEAAPGVTLAMTNIITFFGLHRRWRGALAGHLAAFEMTSSEPNRRYAAGYRRVGGEERGARFYDEHVAADAVHEQVAAHDLCGRLAQDEPGLAPDILFGAAACLLLDGLFADRLLQSWDAARSSLATRATVASFAPSA